MNQASELPNNVDMEKEILAALLVRNGEKIPAVSAIVSADDFYRPEHQIIFRTILTLYAQDIPPNILSVFEALRGTEDLKKIDMKYLLSIAAMSVTNAYAVAHAKIVKEKSDRRRLMNTAENLFQAAQQDLISPADIIARTQHFFDEISRSAAPSNKTNFNEYWIDSFKADVAEMKAYTERKTGFENIDEYQFFTPGLYVIGATPAAGKTTFCQQLLHQLANKGETCIYCSYEMSRLELFSKSLAREMFRRFKHAPTSAQIRRGASNGELYECLVDLAEKPLDFSVLELQDETINDLLILLKPLCSDKAKAPVVCLDYLQIVPMNYESTKLGIDDAVRKLKKFQRDTNTTFIVISSFNRTNYAQSVSFESFKESGNIEYTADVVWALQLNVMNEIKGGDPITQSRRKIDEAKKLQPRQIQLKCLKNRQGTNYDCFFEYHSAHDYFEPCHENAFKKLTDSDDIN